MAAQLEQPWDLAALNAVKRLRSLYYPRIHGIADENHLAVQLAVLTRPALAPGLPFLDLLSSATGVPIPDHAVAMLRREFPALLQGQSNGLPQP